MRRGEKAVWALAAGQSYLAAHTELQTIMNNPGDADSLWAAVATEIVNLFEYGGNQTQSANREMHQRISDFHDRVNQLMGRQTDQEALNAKPVPISKNLCRAYPNPFNNSISIGFNLPADNHVRLEVFNLLGQKVATLVNEPMKAGSHSYSWSGQACSSGMYFYRFQSANHVETQKLMLLK